MNKDCSLPKLFAGLFLLLLSHQPVLAKAVQPDNKTIGKRTLRQGFLAPPDSVRPGVYWYFMDGNISREGMTKDLEAMKMAGIGSVIFLEVNVGIPRGPVLFLSAEWQDLFAHAVREAERLGISLTLGSGPGWAGSGGPWVEPEQSMQHLVASDTLVNGPMRFHAQLAVPKPRKPYFGYGALTDTLRKKWETYYRDVATLAYRTPAVCAKIPEIDEKALFYRAPFSSVKGVKGFLPAPVNYPETINGTSIQKDSILNISSFLNKNGTLSWEVPSGNWTIHRLGVRNNGAVTRPAPQPGLGFECDKMDTAAFNLHYEAFIGKLLQKLGPRNQASEGGWKMIHIDSWEMGAQNWTANFRSEFQKRRHYDLLPFLPIYAGNIVGSCEISERFLWDIRKTAQELVVENHAEHFKSLGRRSGLRLSIEPYDMNPTADLELGAVADVPMCEFWSKNYGYNTSFSCIEATSVAHVQGKPVVQAEAFTAEKSEGWKLYPGAIKDQGDWAFATGINKFFYHTFAHQPLDENLKPGMTMGPYGVHWDRNQTWWPMAKAYHTYIARCSYLLQQGKNVADILYLTPEGAPHVFRPPSSATTGNDTLPDRRGYNFDGVSPGRLLAGASVKNHKICFANGGTYSLLVLPSIETMTPELLIKIESLVSEGACVVGRPPKKSPSLVNYPLCDQEVVSTAMKMWKSYSIPKEPECISHGLGSLFRSSAITVVDSMRPYPNYEVTADILKRLNIKEDFSSNGPIRYAHRTQEELEIYFLSNRSGEIVSPTCHFRVDEGTPELWNPLSGEIRLLNSFPGEDGITSIPIRFDAHQSFFVVFNKKKPISAAIPLQFEDFHAQKTLLDLEGPWKLSFETKLGGPDEIQFDRLEDWSKRPEKGIKYYSGTAKYLHTFLLAKEAMAEGKHLYISLGEVECMAKVTLNGHPLGTLWTAPWRLEITKYLKVGSNILEIEVVNLWPNRLIGDENYLSDGIGKGKWPGWLLEKKPRASERTTFATYNFYKKDAPLLKSGLIGPVRILGDE